jgi:hypothetical protein
LAVRHYQSFKNSLEKSTLLSRAWVQQELNLSLRRIYFGTGQVYWECSEKSHEEVEPETPFTGNTIRGSALSLFRIAADASLSQEDKDRLYYGTWVHLAQSHIQCFITKDDDRLPSIVSIASVMQSLLGSKDEYLAGCWKKWSWLYIMWDVRFPENVQPADNGSPTWSWTSVKPVKTPTGSGRLSFEPGAVLGQPNKEGYRPVAEFFDATCVPLERSFPLGQVKSGFVKAKATLVRLRAKVRIDMTKSFKLMPWLYWKDRELPWAVVPRLDFVQDWETGWHDVYCMPVAHDPEYNHRGFHERLICLLLRRVGGLLATYRRCGACSIVDLGVGSVWQQALTDQAGRDRLDDKDYHVSHGDGCFTITLI